MRHLTGRPRPWHRPAWAALWLWLGLWATACAAPAALPATPQLGANKYDLARQYLGLGAGGDGSPPWLQLNLAMARKALDDAQAARLAFLRISATGFGPAHPGDRNDLALWQADPARHWARMDLMLDDVEARGLQLVVTLNWQVNQFAVLAGQTRRDLVAVPDSAAFRLAARFATEFVQRYRHRRGILFWELTNEMNLGADVDSEARCLMDVQGAAGDAAGDAADESPAACRSMGHYSTDEMIGYLRRMAAVVRAADPTRPLSSGFSMPRVAATALRQNPPWSGRRAALRPDTPEQLAALLKDTHQDMDLISVHLYPKGTPFDRFGDAGIDLLDRLHEMARRAGKPLFVGEFGDLSMDESDQGFNARMLARLKALGVPYAAPWVWQFQYRLPLRSKPTQASAFSLDPERHARTVQRMAAFNTARQQGATPRAPRVVVVWPLPCSEARAGDTVEVTASAEPGQQPAVELWLNEQSLGRREAPPYTWTVPPPRPGSPGLLQAEARATDAQGREARYDVRWRRPGAAAACELPVSP